MSSRELRIGDREREAAISALGEHYVAGRLTKEELDERCDVAWRARTNADLRPLFADLPRLEAEASRPRSAVAPRDSRRHGGPPVLPILLLAVVVVGVLHLAPWPLLVVLVILWLKFFAFRLAGRGRGSSSRTRPTRPTRPR